MSYALCLSAIVALLLACVVRAARPGGLLDFLAPQYEAWQIFKPRWLPDKPTGGCGLCTAFWLPGIPVALAAIGVAGWWALCIPFLIAVLFEIAIQK